MAAEGTPVSSSRSSHVRQRIGVYRFRASDAEAGVLEHVWPAFGEELDIDSPDLVWNPGEAGEEGAGMDVPLPAAFVDAVFVPGA